MKTVALFGATGKAGRSLLNKMLEQNFVVKALVRTPGKLNISSPELIIIRGDVLDASNVFETIRDTDAVISVIGHVKGCPPDLQTRAITNILSAMNRLDIQRLINLTGSGVKVHGDHPKLKDKILVFIMKNLVGKAMRDRLIDGDNHVQLISQSSINWTVVRAPVILSIPAKGKVEVGYVGHISGFSITSDDLTEFMLKTLEENSYIRQYPYITNG